jgi:hypothetical protein
MCSSPVAINKIKASSNALGVICNYRSVLDTIWNSNVSCTAFLENSSTLEFILKNDNGSSSLAGNGATLSLIAQNLSYLQNVFRNQIFMKQGLYTAFQPYSFKMYTTLKNNLT